MLAFVLIAGFPLILGVGFGGLAVAAGALGNPRAADRFGNFLYPLLLAIPLVAALAVVARAGLASEVGLAAPRFPAVPDGLQVPASVGIGAVVGALLFYGEVAVTTLVARLTRPGTVLQVALEGKSREFSEQQRGVSLALLLAISVFVACAEELLWRGFLLHILPEVFGLGTVGAVLVSAVLFGLNHAYFGAANALLKAFAGAVWALLLVASGSLLAPVVSHYVYETLIWRRIHR